MLRIWKSVGLGMVVTALIGAASARAQTGGLTGKATQQDGTPCVKCIVLIERQDIKGTYKVKTDKKGNYTYIGLPIGQYKVTLQDPDGKTLFYINHHVGMGDPTDVDFDLPKEMAAAKQERLANPEAKKQIEAQAKEQKQFSGLKEVFNQGQALYGEKKYAEAAAVFEQAVPIAKEKNLAVVMEHLADSYRMAKQYDKALDTYQKLIAANPGEAEFHNDLGTVYADMSKVTEAQQEFQKAAELNPPGAARYYYNLGVIMVNGGKMDEAAVALKKGTELDPKNANAFYWYGMALLGKAQYKPDGTITPAPGTLEAFQTYLKLDPKGQWAAAAQASVDQLQGKVLTEYKKPKKKG